MKCSETHPCIHSQRTNRSVPIHLDEDFWHHFPNCPPCQRAIVGLLRDWERRTWMDENRN